jgi:hypothetical protein
MGEIEIDPRGGEAQHDEKDRQENEERFDMPSFFSQPHTYNVREKRISVKIKHGSSSVTFLRISVFLHPMPRGALKELRMKRIEVRGQREEWRVKNE